MVLYELRNKSPGVTSSRVCWQICVANKSNRYIVAICCTWFLSEVTWITEDSYIGFMELIGRIALPRDDKPHPVGNRYNHLAPLSTRKAAIHTITSIHRPPKRKLKYYFSSNTISKLCFLFSNLWYLVYANSKLRNQPHHIMKVTYFM